MNIVTQLKGMIEEMRDSIDGSDETLGRDSALTGWISIAGAALSALDRHQNDNELAARANGTVRKAHYGAGRQPWDDIVDFGWAAEFAAGNVLKYMRRTKDVEHSVQSARWYHERLKELSLGPSSQMQARAAKARMSLYAILTKDEIERLT